jgi:peroxiredoxin Q/BCP
MDESVLKHQALTMWMHGQKHHGLGVSADDRASHEAFRDKFSLNFPLRSDVGHKVCDAYGVWGPSKWGDGIRRTTVIVGADGGIKKVFENVSPEGHVEAVLAAL